MNEPDKAKARHWKIVFQSCAEIKGLGQPVLYIIDHKPPEWDKRLAVTLQSECQCTCYPTGEKDSSLEHHWVLGIIFVDTENNVCQPIHPCLFAVIGGHHDVGLDVF